MLLGSRRWRRRRWYRRRAAGRRATSVERRDTARGHGGWRRGWRRRDCRRRSRRGLHGVRRRRRRGRHDSRRMINRRDDRRGRGSRRRSWSNRFRSSRPRGRASGGMAELPRHVPSCDGESRHRRERALVHPNATRASGDLPGVATGTKALGPARAAYLLRGRCAAQAERIPGGPWHGRPAEPHGVTWPAACARRRASGRYGDLRSRHREEPRLTRSLPLTIRIHLNLPVVELCPHHPEPVRRVVDEMSPARDLQSLTRRNEVR